MTIYLLAALMAYLLGSFNPSVLLSKFIYKQDLRKYGSKNPGTSNTVYVLGFKAGAIVLLIDAAKGFFALMLAEQLFGHAVEDLTLLLTLAGFAAVLGHCQSIFLKFKGGKGLATFGGVCLYQFPVIALALLGIFIVTVLLSKYVTVGTFTVITLSPLIQIYLHSDTHSNLTLLLMVLTSSFIWYQHRENFVRILKGTEISIRTPRIDDRELSE